MTGPAIGKVPIDAYIEINGIRIDATFYIHIKGYSLARVTHLDIEDINVSTNYQKRLIPAAFIGTMNGFHVILTRDAKMTINGIETRKFTIRGLKLLQYGEKSGGYVGLKEGGIFLGFKKEIIRRLESIAKKIAPELFK